MIALKPAAAMAVAACSLLAVCSSVPEFEEVRDGHATFSEIPQVVGARGPLTPSQSAAVLERLKREKPNSDILGRHLALEEAVAGTPLTAGNKVTLLQDGDETFDAMFRLMRAAKDHINLEFFIFEDIEHGGTHVVDLLIERQAAGVQVNLIYDAIGSEATPGEVFDRLQKAGVKVHKFNPILPSQLRPRLYNPNYRDHRKILIVDGKFGITGGINISEVYSTSGGSRQKEKKPDEPPEQWRDTDVLIEGPAVADLQRLFVDTWEHETGGPLPERAYFPDLRPAGDEVVRVIASGPDMGIPAFYITLLSAIRTAEQRIWLANSYFAPTDEEVADLTAAAKRGVDVQLLLQGKTDAPLVRDIARSNYADLLEAGVKIYEMKDVILHSKTGVIDGVWSVVGSSNIDTRSVLFNTEVDVVILGRETGRRMEESFVADRSEAEEIVEEEWSQRPFLQKVREFFSRFTAHWM